MSIAKEVNYKAIVLWKKKGKEETEIHLLTQERGLVSAYIGHTRLKSLKNPGYLQPFSYIDVTVKESPTVSYISQIIGQSTPALLMGSLENIAYAAFAGEFIGKLFNRDEINRPLFRLVKYYAQSLDKKAIPIATLILGWQLMSLAGFMPGYVQFKRAEAQSDFLAEVYGTTGISLSEVATELLGRIMAYGWQENEVLYCRKDTLAELERALFAYGTAQIGEPLESLRFLHDLC